MNSKKSNYFPLKLNLSEVSEEPLEFNTSRKSGELNQALQDLIGSEDYQIHLSFQKLGNAYRMAGDVKTALPLTCSDCGGDYLHPVDHHFEELLVVQAPYQKGDQAAKNNHAHEWETDQPECLYLESLVADLGELVHEQVALLEPLRPQGSADPAHVCEDLSQVHRDWLTVGKEKELSPFEKEKSPFKALEGLKLKG
jgi:uncharacterized metal-binding protein YceD (DUF177 family)